MGRVGAEYDILSMLIRHVAGKDFVQSVRILQAPAQGLQQLLRAVTLGRVSQFFHPAFIFCQVLLERVYGEYILRRFQDVPRNGLTQRDLRRDMSVKKFLRHIPLVVQKTDIRCGEAYQRYGRICIK